MRIILVRHGETEENTQKIIQGHNPGTLTVRGYQQIDALATRLATESITSILSSDLLRAAQTARGIAERHLTTIKFDTRIRERCFGIYEGQNIKNYREAADRSNLSALNFCPSQGESLAMLYERAALFLLDIKKRPVSDLLLVSHGGFNRAFLAVVAGLPPEAMFEFEQDNCCLNEIVIHANGADFIQVNSCEHLNSPELFRPGGIFS